MTVLPGVAAIGICPRRPQPRPTKQLSWELASHAKAFLEAQQYANGYTFLYSLLAAGTSISVPARPYVGFLAPAAQLALACTLIAYPATTTQTTSADLLQGSDAALRYLQCVQNTIEGPAYRTIRKAFSFPDVRVRRRPRSGSSTPMPDAGGDVEHLEGTAANAQSIWHRADDFWHSVGWAFNCSVVHKRRWERWRLWLGIMLDFLEADWKASVKSTKDGDADRTTVLQGSLIWQYLSGQDPTNRNTRRRVLKAIFAIGTLDSLRQYPEVWANETADPKPTRADTKPVATVDFDNGVLGDYGITDEDIIMREVARPRRKQSKLSSPLREAKDAIVATTLEEAAEALGGSDAIQLRQRFILLLAQVAIELPTQFTNLEDFFDNLTEALALKDLPTLMLSVLLSTSQLPGHLQLALNVNVLLTLTSPKLPDYTRISPHQSHFEDMLLPLRGTTQSFAANAKVSLLLEHMFMHMIDEGLFTTTGELRAAVKSGIGARQSVVGTGRGKKSNAAEEELGKQLLEESSERLLSLLELLEMDAGKEPRPRQEKIAVQQLLSSFSSSLSPPPTTSGSETEQDD